MLSTTLRKTARIFLRRVPPMASVQKNGVFSIADQGLARKPKKEETLNLSKISLDKIHFHSFIGRDIFHMTDVLYLVEMSDGWKMIDICEKEPLYKTIDRLHDEEANSLVSRHMKLTKTTVRSVSLLELGYEDRDLRERMMEIVSNWPKDELLNVVGNPFAMKSRLNEVYLRARGGVLIDGLSEY